VYPDSFIPSAFHPGFFLPNPCLVLVVVARSGSGIGSNLSRKYLNLNRKFGSVFALHGQWSNGTECRTCKLQFYVVSLDDFWGFMAGYFHTLHLLADSKPSKPLGRVNSTMIVMLKHDISAGVDLSATSFAE
jgi:hypothetical protein